MAEAYTVLSAGLHINISDMIIVPSLISSWGEAPNLSSFEYGDSIVSTAKAIICCIIYNLYRRYPSLFWVICEQTVCIFWASYVAYLLYQWRCCLFVTLICIVLCLLTVSMVHDVADKWLACDSLDGDKAACNSCTEYCMDLHVCCVG